MRLFLMALCIAVALPTQAEDEVAVGLPAPAFSLKAMNPDAAGTNWLALDKFAGAEPEDDGAKLVVLSFFASWCAPCKKEMPFLVQLDRMYREQGLRIIGVCIDTEEPGMTAAKKMLTDNKVGYPVVSDRFNFLARRYLGESAPLPSVFLIRRDGAIARIERGYSKDVSGLLLASIQQELGLKKGSAVARKGDAAEAPKAEVKAEPEAADSKAPANGGKAPAKPTKKATKPTSASTASQP